MRVVICFFPLPQRVEMFLSFDRQDHTVRVGFIQRNEINKNVSLLIARLHYGIRNYP